MKNYVIAGFLLIILTVASLLLPSQILRWQDEQRTEKSETEEVQEVVLREQVSMTLWEKLRLQAQETASVTLVNGKNFNKDTIEEQMKKEIGILAEKHILIDFDTEFLEVDEAVVNFYVDMEDSERSTMFWHGYVQTPQHALSFTMDDETGKIVSFIQFLYDNKQRRYDTDLYDVSSAMDGYDVRVEESFLDMEMEELEEIARRWGEYLGCSMAGGNLYSYGIKPGEEEEAFLIEVEELMNKGYSRKEAEYKVALAWGLDPEEGNAYRAILEDSGGSMPYTLERTRAIFQVTAYLSE